MARKDVLTVYMTPTAAIPMPSPGNTVAPGTVVSIPLNSSFSTLPTSLKYLDSLSYQIVITSADSTGSFALQCSEDQTNWTNVGTAAVVAGTNDIATVWVNLEFCSHYVRLTYTPTITGTGSCTIALTAKQTGG